MKKPKPSSKPPMKGKGMAIMTPNSFPPKKKKK